jgi:micrococcal nuclease
MRKFLIVAAALAALAVPTAAMADVTGAARASEAATVVASVSDGDTLTLRDGRRIRLIQIDTPELGSGECYSRAARTVLLNLAPVGSTVVLEADPTLDKVDRYGRLLRYVHRNGVNVNTELVRRGAAAPYFYRGERGKYAARLNTAVASAKASRRGLWKACPGTPLNPDQAIETSASGPTVKPPPSPTSPPPRPTKQCHPSYAGACLDPAASDYDCAGGSGNGPLYTGKVQVIGPDVFRLDSDGDGYGCE